MGYYLSAETLCERMKSMVSNVDTSEDSYIYNSLMPSSMEIAYALLSLDEVEKKVFATTALESGYSEFIEKRVGEMGVFRNKATYAKIEVTFRGKIGVLINKGSVVSTNDNRLYSVISDVIIGLDGTAKCYVIANSAGSAYNVNAYDINYMPIKYNGIISVVNEAEYKDAYDDETDQALYNRYLLKVQTPATSGNVYQYQQWCLNCTGVGSVKVYPLKDENLQPKNGHVTCVITDSNKRGASEGLINTVKNYIDPNNGTGEGVAPIGATVHIRSVDEIAINITVDIQIDTSTNLDIVKYVFRDSVDKYLKETTFNTMKIGYMKVGSLLLEISGVQDYSNLKINGLTSNMTLNETQIGIIGTVDLGVMS